MSSYNTKPNKNVTVYKGARIYKIYPKQLKGNRPRWLAKYHTGDGKVVQKKEKSMEAAKEFIDDYMQTQEIFGRQLSRWEKLDFLIANRILPSDVSMEDAAKHYVECTRPKETTCHYVRDIIDEYIAEKEKEGVRKHTLKDIKTRMHYLRKRVGQTYIEPIPEGIMPMIMANYAKSLKWSPRTQNNYRAAWFTFFAWAIKKGYCERNPCEEIVKIRIEQKMPKILTPEQAKEFFNILEEANRPEIMTYFALLYFAGLRPNEAKQIEYKYIAEYIHIPPEIAKVRQQRFVTVSDNLKAWLDRYGKARGEVYQFNIDWLYQSISEKLEKRLGMKNLPSNVARHSFASYHLVLHGSAGKTALEMGNSETKLFSNYRSLVTKEQAEAYFNIFPEK